ncbi:NAD(P)-binding protein, partial [Mycena leptocephala]
MTITQDLFAPLVAVVGTTGTQGGSVVRALAESNIAYRIRGFTRDAAKRSAQELAKLGVAIVEVFSVVENKDAVYKAFVGADFAFLVTNFWEHVDMDRLRHGASWTSRWRLRHRVVRPSATKLSGGKYPHVWHFDGKAAVTEYGRQAGVPFVDIQAGAYGSNYLTPRFAPAKQADGSFLLARPVKPTTAMPFIDAEHDYGIFVRHVLEMPVFPNGSELLAYGENITMEDLTAQWSQATGKKIVYQQIPEETLRQDLQSAGLPLHIVLDLTEVLLVFD